MKSIFTVLLATLTIQAQANTVTLSERDVELNVDISSARVRLSGADYSSPVVKVLVPELADVTILDHRNTSESAPCLATYNTLSPEDVIQNNPAVEKVKLKITLAKQAVPNLDKNTCTVRLVESIQGKIRGFTFVHMRTSVIGERHIDDCR